MPLVIRQKLGPFWYRINESDPDSAEFHLRPLTELEFIDVQNEASFHRKRFTLTATGIKSALSHALLNWRNIINESGNEIKFSTDSIDILPKEILQQLANKIIVVSLLTDEEKKTSSSPSTAA